uniref:CCAAT-binding factor domain-containing protein n=1 Tax=Glossina pallidipes TaxID=7398 RepID=A0A1A9Z3C9_GLOPL
MSISAKGSKKTHRNNSYILARPQKSLNGNNSSDVSDCEKKWFEVYTQYPSSGEVEDMKESELMELCKICRSSYEQEKSTFSKKNPSDIRWLQSALRKGTAKDRANAGVLLVTTNPLASLDVLAILMDLTRLSNKSCTDVIPVVTDMWKEVLLPPHRKLYSMQMRAADWKNVRKDASLTNEEKRRIYAYWHFENELKDQYFEFLNNIQQGIQKGQEINKKVSIVVAAQLLAVASEKEQLLLTMLINKLGDPIAKIASKALHHLTEIAYQHPNMCGVIVTETEKLLFRNNISDRAQHFALCFLASIASLCHANICTKLAHICFSLFKVLVAKGAVNNRTMQAILRCLQKAIAHGKQTDDNNEMLSEDMQNTIYRLVHLADIRVSVQTLGLLLQFVTVRTEKSDRFYNALYAKLLDLNLTTIGSKTAAQFLHIFHRAVHYDSNIHRAKAFIKRLLQLALYMPSNISAGCLIVIHKLLYTRKELIKGEKEDSFIEKSFVDIEDLEKFNGDCEEKYEDVLDDDEEQTKKNIFKEPKPTNNEKEHSSWHHARFNPSSREENVCELNDYKKTYDPYHRSPTFSGAEFAAHNELLCLYRHFHPTVKVFAENIIEGKRISYYGDPLNDFGLSHFLERFSFKNPKKINELKTENQVAHGKDYLAKGSRGLPIKSLTKATCTEDEIYIFNFFEQKRQKAASKEIRPLDKEDDDDDLKTNEVDDDEFEEYLNGYFGKKVKKRESGEEQQDLDFLKELGDDLQAETKRGKKKKEKSNVDVDDANDVDWTDDEEGADFIGIENSDDQNDSVSCDEEGDVSTSASESECSDNDKPAESNSDSPSIKPKRLRKSKTSSQMDERSFAKKLKSSDDMTKLFAAADDFSELLESSKEKAHGTINAVFNKDKSSQKQLKWEEARRSNSKTYMGHRKRKFRKQ